MNERPDVAYYYPAPYWMPHETDWIKSLLLFFDRVAILLPGYMYGRHRTADPTLARGRLRTWDCWKFSNRPNGSTGK